MWLQWLQYYNKNDYFNFQGLQYLIDKECYHRKEATWEPESLLPIDIVQSFFPRPLLLPVTMNNNNKM